MKKILLAILVLGAFSLSNFKIYGQNNWKKLYGETEEFLTGKNKLTEDEVIAGLKDALRVGTNKSVEKANRTDGYYKNKKIKIPFPEDAQKVKQKAESIGMKKDVDKFILTMNRAAEEAAKEAAPIFIDAIKTMSIKDGFDILKGEDNAATKYLEGKTYNNLKVKYAPIVKKAIDKVYVTKYWNPLITKYNMATKLTGGDEVNPDLEEYITEKALYGLFTLLADEEHKIRKDPKARITDILKKVFGSDS